MSDLATAYVARDPFARGEYARFSFARKGQTCAWCGDVRRVLFVYLWQDDSIRARVPRRSDAEREHRFCNIGCHRNYHG
jgi:hypothetical protein